MHHGMLTIYKEKGYTSSDAVARLRGILRMRKIGHTGTLDPDAEGVLPMCLGNATRICELIADREKEYLAVMRLGVRTDTQDMSGEILSEMTGDSICAVLLQNVQAPAQAAEAEQTGQQIPSFTDEQIRKIYERIIRVSAGFTGEIEQIPPMYSAIKINGKRLYDMARKGITVERKPRRITIHSLKIEKVELPLVTMRVRCSKGTYIRTLCEDLGNALGTGAAMQSLLRTRVGQFTLDEALTLDEIERLAKTEPGSLSPLIRPVDSFFADLPAAECLDDSLRLLKNGNALTDAELRFLSKEEDPRGNISGGVSDLGGTGVESKAASDCSVHRTDNLLSGLPGIGPGDSVIRLYDTAGRFYGLYRSGPKGRKYYAYKMFLPEN